MSAYEVTELVMWVPKLGPGQCKACEVKVYIVSPSQVLCSHKTDCFVYVHLPDSEIEAIRVHPPTRLDGFLDSAKL